MLGKHSKQMSVSVHVVHGSRPNLMGRDRLNKLGMRL